MASAITDDGWIPVKHYCLDIPLAAVRIQFANDTQKQQILYRAAYLQKAKLPYVQPIYDFFVQDNEVILIVLRPQATVHDLILQSPPTDAQKISVNQSLLSALFAIHRHRLTTDVYSLRDFLVINDVYFCLAVEVIVKPKCICCTSLSNLALTIHLIGQLLGRDTSSEWAECSRCLRRSNLSNTQKAIKQLQILSQESAIYALCEKLLAAASWSEAADLLCLNLTTPPLFDETDIIFKAKRCQYEKQGINPALQLVDSLAQGRSMQSDIQLRVICQAFVTKHGLSRDTTELFFGLRTVVLQKNSNKDFEEGQLLEFVKKIHIEPRSARSLVELALKQGSGSQTYNTLNLGDSKLSEIEIRAVKQGISKILDSGKAEDLEELLILLRMQMHAEGIVLVKTDEPHPANFLPFTPIIDVNKFQAPTSLQIIDYNDRVKQLEKQLDFLSKYSEEHQSATLRMSIIAQLTQILQIIFISQLQTEQLDHQLKFAEFSKRDSINQQYKGITLDNIQNIKFQKVPKFEKGRLEYFISQIFKLSMSYFTGIDKLNYDSFSIDSITDFVRVNISTCNINNLKIFSLLLISLIDSVLIIGCKNIKESSIYKQQLHYLFNFRSVQSQLQNNAELHKKQLQFFVTCMCCSFLLLEKQEYPLFCIMLQNLLCPDVFIKYFYQKVSSFKLTHQLFKQSQIPETDQIKYKMFEKIKTQYNLICLCDGDEKMCRKCATLQQQQFTEKQQIFKMLRVDDSIEISNLLLTLLTENRKVIKENISDERMIKILLDSMILSGQMTTQTNTLITSIVLNSVFEAFHTEREIDYRLEKLFSYLLNPLALVDQLQMDKHGINFLKSIKQRLLPKQVNNQPIDTAYQQKFLNLLHIFVLVLQHHQQYVKVQLNLYLTQNQKMSLKSSLATIDQSDHEQLFTAIFGTAITDYQSLFSFSLPLLEVIGEIAQQQLDPFVICSIFKTNSEPYLNDVVFFCESIMQLSKLATLFIDTFNKRLSKFVEYVPLPLDMCQSIVSKICSSRLLKYCINFQGLEALSRCTQMLTLPPQLIVQILNPELVRKQMVYQDPEVSQLVFARFARCLRAVPVAHRHERTQSFNSSMLNTMSTVNLSILQSPQMTSPLKLTGMTELVKPLAELCGPLFCYYVVASAAECSFDIAFWDGDEAWQYCVAALKPLLSLKKQLPPAVAEDVVIILVNAEKLAGFRPVVSPGLLIQAVLRPDIAEPYLIFLLKTIAEQARENTQSFQQYATLMFKILKQSCVVKHCLSVTHTALELMSLPISTELQQQLPAFFSSCWDGKKQSDVQIRQTLMIITHLFRLQIFEGFVEAGLQIYFIDILKQRPLDCKELVIECIHRGRLEASLVDGFSRAQLAAVLKRLVVGDEHKTMFAELRAIFK